jgi:hypothetical protein
MVLEAQLQQAMLLKKVVDAMKDLCKDVNFDCSEKGLQRHLPATGLSTPFPSSIWCWRLSCSRPCC